MTRPGFTLVELLIVVAVLGLVTSLLSPFARGNQDQALLGRTADTIRQAWYTTVMEAKTGAGTDALPPLRGWYMDQTNQHLRAVTIPRGFDEIASLSLEDLRPLLLEGRELLALEPGDTSSLATLTLAPHQEMLLLMEPVSNRVRLHLPGRSGTSALPNQMTITLAHPDRPHITRTLSLYPATSLLHDAS